MIRGASNDLVARPAGDSARALQQLSDCGRHRLSDGALLFVPGRCRTASTGRRRSGTRLEAALTGTMADKLTAEERGEILQWVRAGATADGYPKIEPILTQKCAACHSAQSGMPILPLTSFEDVQKVTTPDTGVSMLQLARVSHIHLFGISMMFVLTGAIFSLSVTPVWFRVAVLVVPYLAIIMDIGSWWATKYYDPVFAYIVLIGGAFMGLAMACQILVSLWDIWIAPFTASAWAKPKDIRK